jgi:uncharacterized protein
MPVQCPFEIGREGPTVQPRLASRGAPEWVMQLALALASTILLLFSTTLGTAAAPSFDCSRARTTDEIAICGNPQLSELDRRTTAAFNSARASAGERAAKEIARRFLSSRQQCGADAKCIRRRQVEAIESNQALSKPTENTNGQPEESGSSPLPSTVGSGSTSKIAKSAIEGYWTDTECSGRKEKWIVFAGRLQRSCWSTQSALEKIVSVGTNYIKTVDNYHRYSYEFDGSRVLRTSVSCLKEVFGGECRTEETVYSRCASGE